MLEFRKILGLIVLLSGSAFGQSMDTLAADTIRKIPENFIGAYFDSGSKLAPNPPGINQTNFLGGGIQYNSWSLGFSVYNFNGTTKRFLIFPNVFELDYRYGGPRVSYRLYSSKWLDVIGETSYYKGDMTWKNSDDGEDFLRSEFNIWILGLKLEVGKWQFLRPYLNIGYQQMFDLNLYGVEDEEFSGFFFGVGLRLGYFNQ